MIFIIMSLKQSIRRVLKEEISAKDAYNEYDSVKTIIDGKRDVAFTTLDNISTKALIFMNGLKKIKLQSGNYIVYRKGAEKMAEELLNIANKYGGTLHYDASEEDSRRIGQILNYHPSEIEDYIQHNKKIKTNEINESIRKILKEEIDILSIRRRLFIVDDYIQNLSSKDICDYWVSDEVDNYVNETMAEIVRVMLDSIRGINADNWHDTYEEIYELLIDLGYREEIEDFFYDSLDNCDKIIKENNSHINRKEKLQKLIDNEIDLMKNICEYMDSESEEEFISFDACDFLDLDPKVRVTSVDKLNGVPRILVVIEYEAMMHFHDEETFISELQYRLRKWITNVKIDVEDVINTYPDEKRQW